MLDVEALLQPVSPEAPSGPNLEYAPAFADLERAVEGKPERQVGEVVVAAESPEWRPIIDKAVALLATSKDLRIGAHLARGMVEVHSFGGLAEALTLLRRTVDEFWPTCHPQLDADDDNDPTVRINAMAGLSKREMLNAVRAAPIVKSRAFGEIRFRDIEAAAGKRPEGAPAVMNLDAAFQDVTPESLTQAGQALQQCVEESKKLEEVWAAHLDGGGPNLTELRRVLFQANEAIKGRVAMIQPANGAQAADGAPPSVAAPSNGAAPGAGFRGGEPRSRDEVIKALDAILAYYGRYEPSSPVPLLIERCKRLVPMSFIDIVKDMVPDGLANVETIAGKPRE
jgi:type VI secretion system protein ImpA